MIFAQSLTFGIWMMGPLVVLSSQLQKILNLFCTGLLSWALIWIYLNVSCSYLFQVLLTSFIYWLLEFSYWIHLMSCFWGPHALTVEALSPVFQSKLSTIHTLVSRLEVLIAHDALYLLRHCFAIPKLLYLLWISSSWRIQSDLQSFDETIRSYLSSNII